VLRSAIEDGTAASTVLARLGGGAYHDAISHALTSRLMAEALTTSPLIADQDHRHHLLRSLLRYLLHNLLQHLLREPFGQPHVLAGHHAFSDVVEGLTSPYAPLAADPEAESEGLGRTGAGAGGRRGRGSGGLELLLRVGGASALGQARRGEVWANRPGRHADRCGATPAYALRRRTRGSLLGLVLGACFVHGALPGAGDAPVLARQLRSDSAVVSAGLHAALVGPPPRPAPAAHGWARLPVLPAHHHRDARIRAGSWLRPTPLRRPRRRRHRATTPEHRRRRTPGDLLQRPRTTRPGPVGGVHRHRLHRHRLLTGRHDDPATEGCD
jgi:hypothetical protein